MKRAHEEGRAWNIGNNRRNNKKSWPEEFFSTFLENNSIDYVYEYSLGKFSIDFAIPNRKIAIEIDGKQHFEDKKQVLRDKEKNLLLEKNGWNLLRISWIKMFNDTKNVLIETLEWLKTPTTFKTI